MSVWFINSFFSRCHSTTKTGGDGLGLEGGGWVGSEGKIVLPLTLGRETAM